MKKSSITPAPTDRHKKGWFGPVGLVGLFIGLAWLMAACAEFTTPTPVPAQVGATSEASPTTKGALVPIPTIATTAPSATTAAVPTTSAATTAAQTTPAATTATRITQPATTAARTTIAAITTRAVTTAPTTGETLKTPKASVGATTSPRAAVTTAAAKTTAASSDAQTTSSIKKTKFLDDLAAVTYAPTPKVSYAWTAYKDDINDFQVIFIGKGQGGDYMCDLDGLQSYEGPKNLPELLDGGYKKLTTIEASVVTPILEKLPCNTEDRKIAITSATEATEVRDRYLIDESGDGFTDNLTGLTYTLQDEYYVTRDGVYFIYNNKLWKIEED